MNTLLYASFAAIVRQAALAQLDLIDWTGCGVGESGRHGAQVAWLEHGEMRMLTLLIDGDYVVVTDANSWHQWGWKNLSQLDTQEFVSWCLARFSIGSPVGCS